MVEPVIYPSSFENVIVPSASNVADLQGVRNEVVIH
jgi:hypothetical protein